MQKIVVAFIMWIVRGISLVRLCLTFVESYLGLRWGDVPQYKRLARGANISPTELCFYFVYASSRSLSISTVSSALIFSKFCPGVFTTVVATSAVRPKVA